MCCDKCQIRSNDIEPQKIALIIYRTLQIVLLVKIGDVSHLLAFPHQCDKIGLLLDVVGNDCPYKRSANYWWLSLLIWQRRFLSKNCYGQFYATFWKNWLLFVSISGHTVPHSHSTNLQSCISHWFWISTWAIPGLFSLLFLLGNNLPLPYCSETLNNNNYFFVLIIFKILSVKFIIWNVRQNY